MATAFLFPGQGAQQVGMGADLYEAFASARAMFDRAEEVTGLPLKKLCFEGPEDQLARTDVSQPAIFTMSMVVLTVANDLLGPDKGIRPDVCAGLSLGEYTALCAAGAVSFDDALMLVTRRGQYMREAAEASVGGMVSLIGADEDAAREVCAAASDGEVLVPANFNCPGQIVISGSAGACKRAAAMAGELGCGGAVELKVAGAFHSPLMQPAAERLSEALDKVQFSAPVCGVYSNVTAQPHGDGESIRQGLLAQLTQPVRWQQCCEAILAGGADELLEIGPGRVLTGLMRRIDRKARVTSLNGREAVEKLFGAGAGAEKPAG